MHTKTNSQSHNWTSRKLKIFVVSKIIYINPSGNAPHFIILLCLMPDYFTLSNTRRFYRRRVLPLNGFFRLSTCPCMHPVNPLSAWQCTVLYYFTLSNTRQFYLSGGECCHSMHGLIDLSTKIYNTFDSCAMCELMHLKSMHLVHYI
jgi:hypothetical protein